MLPKHIFASPGKTKFEKSMQFSLSFRAEFSTVFSEDFHLKNADLTCARFGNLCTVSMCNISVNARLITMSYKAKLGLLEECFTCLRNKGS